MNKLIAALLAAALVAPAIAADGAKADAKPASNAAEGQIVTPQSQADAMKATIDKLKSNARPKTEKPAEAKK